MVAKFHDFGVFVAKSLQVGTDNLASLLLLFSSAYCYSALFSLHWTTEHHCSLYWATHVVAFCLVPLVVHHLLLLLAFRLIMPLLSDIPHTGQSPCGSSALSAAPQVDVR